MKRLSELLHKSGFSKLNQREKIIVLVGIAVLFCIILMQFIVSPYLEASSQLTRNIEKRKEALVELRQLQQEYRQLTTQTGSIKDLLARRSNQFSLFTFLDSKAAQTGVKQYISYMKPSSSDTTDGDLQETLVEMKMVDIPLEKVVAYLQLIESPENVVSIKRISIQESSKEQGQLEVVMQIVTFTEKG